MPYNWTARMAAFVDGTLVRRKWRYAVIIRMNRRAFSNRLTTMLSTACNQSPGVFALSCPCLRNPSSAWWENRVSLWYKEFLWRVSLPQISSVITTPLDNSIFAMRKAEDYPGLAK